VNSRGQPPCHWIQGNMKQAEQLDLIQGEDSILVHGHHLKGNYENGVSLEGVLFGRRGIVADPRDCEM
jgi:hypothetical protein